MAGDVGSNWENLSIYYANLSPIFVCSSLFTILALVFTWWFSTSNQKRDKCKKDADQRDKSKNQDGLSRTLVGSSFEETFPRGRRESTNAQQSPNQITSDKNNDTSMGHIKTIRQTEIEKQLTAGLSEQQLLDERNMQASQLAAIYKLLKEKEDEFQIRSMDELEEQLRLYRS